MQGQPETARIQITEISQNDLEESRENYRYVYARGWIRKKIQRQKQKPTKFSILNIGIVLVPGQFKTKLNGYARLK